MPHHHEQPVSSGIIESDANITADTPPRRSNVNVALDAGTAEAIDHCVAAQGVTQSAAFRRLVATGLAIYEAARVRNETIFLRHPEGADGSKKIEKQLIILL